MPLLIGERFVSSLSARDPPRRPLLADHDSSRMFSVGVQVSDVLGHTLLGLSGSGTLSFPRGVCYITPV